MAQFADRRSAGRTLGRALQCYDSTAAVVLGLPRGGVPVAFEVACALKAPLGVLVVRKLGVPSQPELAMGAVGEGGVVVIDEETVRSTGVSADLLADVQRAEQHRLEEDVATYRSGGPVHDIAGRTVIIVDDGIATGATARAACLVARSRGASAVVVATPVIAPEAVEMLRSVADDLIWCEAPARFGGVGRWFMDFAPVTSAEVLVLLGTSTHAPPPT